MEYLSVSCGSPTLAAGVAAVGPQRSTLHRVWRAGRVSCAALRETQASAIVLLALHTIFKHICLVRLQPDVCSYIMARAQRLTFLARVQCSMVMRRPWAVLREEKRYARRRDGADRNIRPEDQLTLCRNSSVSEPTAHALQTQQEGDTR